MDYEQHFFYTKSMLWSYRKSWKNFGKQINDKIVEIELEIKYFVLRNLSCLWPTLVQSPAPDMVSKAQKRVDDEFQWM